MNGAIEDGAIYLVLFRSVAAGALVSLAVGMLRGRVAKDIRLAGVAACLSAAGFMIFQSGAFQLAGPFGLAVAAAVVAFPLIGLSWLFILTLFEDWKVTPVTLLPAFATLLLNGLQVLSGVGDVAFVLVMALSVLLMGHTLFALVRGWRDDLVEARRRLRLPLFGLVTAVNLYILWRVGLDLGFVSERFYARTDLFNAIFEAAWAILAVGVLLEGRAALLGLAPRRSDRAAAADSQALARLHGLMEDEGVWRREGLTIGALAKDIGVSDQRLRRLINGELGHRNFAEFINGYRIEAAKARLADPAAQGSIAEVAFDLGFTSLGPFNRAFKAVTGETPTRWRAASSKTAPPSS